MTDTNKFYHQIIFGDGIGSYHGLPDAAPESATTDKVLRFTGWMVGYTRDWTDHLNSNFTYAENALDNTLLQAQDDVRGTTYLAANLIWEPVDRVNVGIEYLYGARESANREKGDAHWISPGIVGAQTRVYDSLEEHARWRNGKPNRNRSEDVERTVRNSSARP